MALYWYVHSIPFTNFLWTTKKQTFLRFWFGPGSLASHRLEDIRRHVVNMVQQLPQDQRNHRLPTIHFFRCYATFQVQNMTIKSHGIDSQPFYEKSVGVLSKRHWTKKDIGEMRNREDIGQKKNYCYQLHLRSCSPAITHSCSQPAIPKSCFGIRHRTAAKKISAVSLTHEQPISLDLNKTTCTFSCLPTEGQI